MDQARDALSAERINTEHFLRLYGSVTGGDVWEKSMPLAARRLWAEVLEAMELRRRILNGSSRIGEDKLQRYAWVVLRFINRLREHHLGDPLKELPKRTRKTRSDESLKKRLEGTAETTEDAAKSQRKRSWWKRKKNK